MEGYIDYLKVIFLFGLIGAILLWLAKSYGFFVLPHGREKKTNPVGIVTLIAAFTIYLGMTMVIAPLLAKAIEYFYSFLTNKNIPNAAFSWLQLLILGAIFTLFYLSCRAQDPLLFRKIWKDRTIARPTNIAIDFLMGIMTWIISFPLVLAIGQLADMALYFFFKFENYEQVAVHYLKTTLESPAMLSVALFTILIAAPIIEEFLFRGCLLTYLKRYMPIKGAIVLSALCFSLFHFAPSQGLGNISLVASLFVLALFLGFIYERQASLFASIGLHMTFNAVSTFRIVFFPD